jgi:hypothetical protein
MSRVKFGGQVMQVVMEGEMTYWFNPLDTKGAGAKKNWLVNISHFVSCEGRKDD